MACPFFLPTHRHDRELWTFRARLPLGDGWAGKCTAHDAAPTDDALRDHCNLGYAHACPHLPQDRHADAVHFSVAVDNGGMVSLHFAFELGHAPAGSGRLDYDCAASRWISPHPDARVQAMAAAYLEAYFTRHPRPALSAKTS